MALAPLFIGTIMRIAPTIANGAKALCNTFKSPALRLSSGQGVKRAIATVPQKKEILAKTKEALSIWNNLGGKSHLRFTPDAFLRTKNMGFHPNNGEALVERANNMLRQTKTIALARLVDGEMLIRTSRGEVFKGIDSVALFQLGGKF